MNRKIIFYRLSLIVALIVIGILCVNNYSLRSKEIIIGNENILGQEDSFGSTVAIYVEQTEGQGDYIQKNNVPDDGSIYVVNSATHCIGGGI